MAPAFGAAALAPGGEVVGLTRSSRIYVAGHRGMVGSALVRLLEREGFSEIVTAARKDLDLCSQPKVEAFFQRARPEFVVMAAARVGGIQANSSYPAEFIYENLAMATNVIQSAHAAGVERLLFLGSSCIYPQEMPQPLGEGALLQGPLEPTNEAYAIAKIAGLKLCQYYRAQYGRCYHSAMPTNLYGPSDNYHFANSHVVAALLRRFHEAREAGAPAVVLWGTGKPRREFLHVDDLARACLRLLQIENPPDWINVGWGKEIAIGELARLIAEIVGYQGELQFDATKPDGTPRKCLDISWLQSLGWEPRISLREGLESTYRIFCEELAAGQLREV